MFRAVQLPRQLLPRWTLFERRKLASFSPRMIQSVRVNTFITPTLHLPRSTSQLQNPLLRYYMFETRVLYNRGPRNLVLEFFHAVAPASTVDPFP